MTTSRALPRATAVFGACVVLAVSGFLVALPPAAPDAAVRLFFTGSDDGYLDACGCDDGLLGGLPRRHTLLKELGAYRGEATLLLSNGRLVAGSSPLDEMKFETIMQAMATLGYQGIALTERELALGRAQIEGMAAYLGEGCPWLATNLDDAPPEGARAAAGAGAAANEGTASATPWRRSMVSELGGREVVVLAAIAPSRAALFRAADPHVRVSDPIAALQAEIASRPDAWKVIVLAQMSIDEAKALALALPRIDLIVVQGPDHADHPAEEAVHVGSTAIVTTGRKGKFVGSWRFGEAGELDEFRPEPVIDSLEKSPDVQDLIVRSYRDRLVEDDPRPILAWLEQRPTASGAEYVGAEEGSCASCHPQAWATWAASKHAHAWKTLVDQDLPPQPPESDDKKGRQKNAIWDPDCVRCHVTGFGEIGGWGGIEKEKLRPDAPLVNVGCEACHGPAGDHAQRASAGDPSWPGGHLPRIWSKADAAKDPAGALRDLPAAQALCMRCHDPDNSPAFELEEYWRGFVRGEQRAPVRHGKE